MRVSIYLLSYFYADLSIISWNWNYLFTDLLRCCYKLCFISVYSQYYFCAYHTCYKYIFFNILFRKSIVSLIIRHQVCQNIVEFYCSISHLLFWWLIRRLRSTFMLSRQSKIIFLLHHKNCSPLRTPLPVMNL